MIYVQSKDNNSMPHHFDCSCGMWGAIETGKKYRLTSYEEIESGKFDSLLKKYLFVGSTEFMQLIFKRALGKEIRIKNSNRKSEIITLQEAYEKVRKGIHIFIKPVQQKLFTGLILDGSIYTQLQHVPLNSLVFSYEPFKKTLISEWRIYVLENKIIDSRNYSGDFMISPNYIYIESVIKENTDLPISYIIDIGIFEDGENIVVEFNDMWAIGNYGIPNDLYLKLLTKRYFEIMNNN